MKKPLLCRIGMHKLNKYAYVQVSRRRSDRHADNIIERLDKLLHQTDDDARLRELAEADKDGRVVVLPEGGEKDG